MWARLLASAVSDTKHQHPSYIKVLAELSPLDAKLLREIFSNYKNNYGTDEKPKHYLLKAMESLILATTKFLNDFLLICIGVVT